MPFAGQFAPPRSKPKVLEAVPARLLALTLLLLQFLPGCSLLPDVRHKPQYINPFPQLKSIAVLPFANQSEEPTLSGERVSLAYMDELQAIRGFEVLPLGAVKRKMSEFQRPLASGADFQAFAQFLGVDAVLIGAITDYDPYYPPRMSLKVSWYAANPGFHPVQVGYGLPWGTKEEKKIPGWIHYEAQRALAAEQLKTQTPQPPDAMGLASERGGPIMPEDRPSTAADGRPAMLASPEGAPRLVQQFEQPLAVQWSAEGAPLPPDWPDPRGFIPDPPAASRPPFLPQGEPIISHMRNFNGHDEDFTEQLADYFYYRDDARFGGWQAYLQRSEDFIRFCCHLHVVETLSSRGGQDKSRLIFRWPLDRYSR
ncbi:MAG: hypothetical protein KDA45_12710 [Planctomycetales bacterium]|nr:hypothetical protein [Planctomycetales bacterium]